MYPDKPKILMIGSLPPPFIGPTIATERLLSTRNLQQAFEIIFLDISDNRDAKNVGEFELWNICLALVHIVRFSFLVIFHKPKLIYLNISQGIWGYLRDLGFLLPAIILRRKVVLHLRGSEFGEFDLRM